MGLLTLIRDVNGDKAVMGKLYFNGGLVCYTLENATNAIPCGVYYVQNSKSPKFKRELPLICNSGVPSSRGIRMHRGNTAKDSQGCILVGMGRDVKNSFMNYPPAKDRWVSCATGASVVSCSRQLVLPVSTGLTTKVPPVPGVLD